MAKKATKGKMPAFMKMKMHEKGETKSFEKKEMKNMKKGSKKGC